MSARFEEICGGVTSPEGFVAGAVRCGIKGVNTNRPDIAMVFSPAPTVAAATFTTNRVKAAPVRVSAAYLKSPDIRGIIANSGNANACTGLAGIEDAKRMARSAAKAFGLKDRQVLVCSTGRIGVPLPIERMEECIATLPKNMLKDGSLKAARAIMTSDTFPKEVAVTFKLGRRRVRIGGIAKGAGMIDPNMATMLCFLTTDAPVPKAVLQEALSTAVSESFNRITVDGDMSTNDTVIALANGLAGGTPLKAGSRPFQLFQAALTYVARRLAWMIVEDGEGVSKFVQVCVKGASSREDAQKAAEAVANSTLVKCSWYGQDPNWGRLMDAIGYCGARLREEIIDIYYDGVLAVRNGMASKTPFAKLLDVMRKERFTIIIDLNLGSEEYSVFTTDLTTRYVELNMGE